MEKGFTTNKRKLDVENTQTHTHRYFKKRTPRQVKDLNLRIDKYGSYDKKSNKDNNAYIVNPLDIQNKCYYILETNESEKVDNIGKP